MIPLITSLDALVLQALYTWRTPEFTAICTALTALGNVFVISIVALALAVVLWRHRRFEYKAGFAVALGGSLFASYLVKIIVARPRPPETLQLIAQGGYSFPSMHAAVALATYGFIAYAAWKLMRPPRHRLPLVVFLCALVFLIGFSRVYLGVHYPSDVVGGFVIGAFFLWLGIWTTNRFRNRATF